MAEKYCAVVLAAGEGKRMKSNRPKVLSEVLFKPMLRWVLDAVQAAAIKDICCVAGHRHEQVEAYLAKANETAFAAHPVRCVLQRERRGTGHAVMMARSFLEEHRGGQVLVLNGDAPFLTPETIAAALQAHCENGNAATVISAQVQDPVGYGRIVRSPKDGLLAGIVEQKDADEAVQKICEINSGSYWFAVDDLLEVLSDITSNNAQGEYYLTDAIALLIGRGKRASAFTAEDSAAVLGANDCMQLFSLNQIARDRVLQRHMAAGISIPCKDGVIIGPDVRIGAYSCILPGSILQGSTVVGEDCTIGPNTILQNAMVEDHVLLNSVQVYNKKVAEGDLMKPYSVLR
ncbi:MAG: NTP transferase domain-containing protein [Oscillospiraceae bacterium]|jgi:bifunctional UDP-N-acetylglucosamine pyrophosphorylase/glucosamine-1-phosphate N-acetyltransferase|nr:NTP transferase domain-containing protein [Oscillospiraceae bacterium]MDD3260616.1 NTP transferase domain-containing protein [Oscillospiraceae bacterium]